MKSFTQATLANATLGAALNTFITAHGENMAAIAEVSKVISAQNDVVQKAFGMCFTSNPHTALSVIKKLATGGDDNSNALVQQVNKAGWNEVETLIGANLCALAKQNFRNSTIWSDAVPTLSQESLVIELDKIADIQQAANDALELSNELNLSEGSEIDLKNFKSKTITLDQLDRLHTLIAKMKIEVVNIQNKGFYAKLVNQSIKSRLVEAQKLFTSVDCELFTAKFFKNGNVEVKVKDQDIFADFT